MNSRPSLPFEAWKDTRATLHMWTQIGNPFLMEAIMRKNMAGWDRLLRLAIAAVVAGSIHRHSSR